MRDTLPQNPWGLPQPPRPQAPTWADLADYFKTSGQQLGVGYDDVTGAIHNRDVGHLMDLGAAATEPFAATKGKGGQALQVLKSLFGYGGPQK